jgi:hypothetical protein
MRSFRALRSPVYFIFFIFLIKKELGTQKFIRSLRSMGPQIKNKKKDLDMRDKYKKIDKKT